MTYNGLINASNPEVPHLGGSVIAGDPYTYCPSVWDYAISRFAIESVLDLGSGSGNASHYFYKKNLKVLAVEGLRENVDRSLYPAIMHDLTKGAVHTKADLVHCHEVVEHIEEQFLENLLDSLTCGKYILMTHAVPNQDGHHHVNCQPSSYWIAHLARKNCVLLEGDSIRIRKLAEKDGAIYMANTGMIFHNTSRI